MINLKYVKSPLKWIGGKNQILENIIEKIPNEIDSYYEPFLGGGTILIQVLYNKYINKIKINNIYASDINPALIYLFKNIQSNYHLLIDELNIIINIYNNIITNIINRNPLNLDEAKSSQESYYYWIRQEYNKLNNKTIPLASAMFLFLNKTGFRGLYREGPNGYNVPFGHYKNPTVYDLENIKTLNFLFKDVIFEVCSYEKIFERLKNNDFIYLDPPYMQITKTSFVSYVKNGFNNDFNENLFNLCQELYLKNIKFIMSNAYLEYIINKFKNCKIETISCKRRINSKNPDSKVDELIIYN